MRPTRPTMRDNTMDTSATNPSFQQRIETALAFEQAERDIANGNGPNLPGWTEVNKANQAKTLAENVYRGYSARDTQVTQRIAGASEREEMTWDKRGETLMAEQAELVKADKKQQAELSRHWKSKEQEMEDIADRLSTI